ncbi:MAG TPA: hypothetical protein VEG30_18475 [Terriglobales bacterium]|nr:hypothetical protein [Terriglobales bacterium]
MHRYRDPRELLAEVRSVLRQNVRQRQPRLQPVMDLLYEGRHYRSVVLYLQAAGNSIAIAFRGVGEMAADCITKGDDCDAELQAVLGSTGAASGLPEGGERVIVPVSVGQSVLGAIKVLAEEDHTLSVGDQLLIREIAREIALFLTGKGKYILRKLAGYQGPERRPQELSQAA